MGDDEHSWSYDGQRGKKWNGTDTDYGLAFDRDDASTPNGTELKGSSNSDSKVVLSETATPAALGDDQKDSSASKHVPWVVGDVVGCLLDITGEGEEAVANMGFTLNGISLGLAFSNIQFAAQKYATSSSSSEERSAMGFYPALSLEDGEAVLLNIGQRPFSFRPSDDIIGVGAAAESNASISAAAVCESTAIAAVIEKKPPAVKRGRKSKKDIAAEKAAEETAMAEAEREAEALAEDAREAVRKKSSSSSPMKSSISIPYQPVLLSLDSAVREMIPVDGAWDSSVSVSHSASLVSDKGVPSVGDEETVAAIADVDK